MPPRPNAHGETVEFRTDSALVITATGVGSLRTLHWTPVLTGLGYELWRNGAKISSTKDPKKSAWQVKLALGENRYEIRAIVYGPSGKITLP